MPRRQFIADLQKALGGVRPPGIHNIKAGEDDGHFEFEFASTEEGTTHTTHITAMITDVSDYPESHEYMIFCGDNTPGHVAQALQNIRNTRRKTVFELIDVISASLTALALPSEDSDGDHIMGESQQDLSDESEDDDADETSDSPTKLSLVPIPAPRSAVEDSDPERINRSTSLTEDAAPLGVPRVEVVFFLDFMKYRLGCNIFSASNWRTSAQNDKVLPLPKAMLALSFKEESKPSGPEVGEAVISVVRTLSKPSPFSFRDLPDSFDHGASNGIRLGGTTLQVSLGSAAEGPLYLIHPPGHIHQYPWVIATVHASTVLLIFRRGWDSMGIIARELTQQGVPFSTVSAIDRRYKAPPALPIRGLGTRPAQFRPSIIDYNEYVRRREDLLRGPRGRAALMHGGLVARIARDVLDVNIVLDGPSPNSITVGQHGPFFLFDDRLTADDLDVICGVYYVFSEGAPSSGGGQRGDGTRTHLSWWPQFTTWDASRCFIRTQWTELAEAFYQKWLAYRAKDVAATVFGATSWKTKLRKHNAVTSAIDECSEHCQAAYLQNYLFDIRSVSSCLLSRSPKSKARSSGYLTWRMTAAALSCSSQGGRYFFVAVYTMS